MGERTTRAHTWPAALKSSPNRPRPRSSRGSSLRGIRVPITVMGRPARRRDLAVASTASTMPW